eukprot:4802556-Amphidinium_carterae.1
MALSKPTAAIAALAAAACPAVAFQPAPNAVRPAATETRSRLMTSESQTSVTSEISVGSSSSSTFTSGVAVGQLLSSEGLKPSQWLWGILLRSIAGSPRDYASLARDV